MVACPAPGPDEGDRIVRLIAGHVREIGTEQPPRLLGDRREQLVRWRRTRHEGRDPAQRRLDPPGRRLLLDELRKLPDQDPDGRSDDHEHDQRNEVGC
jgi:hypothetical protein